MFANSQRTQGQRRGVVLILILGMLGLLALIGVTFATFSNQAQISARNFSLAQNFPDASEMMDFALSQLIDDTFNNQSVIRGHSLRRDMYGNDAYYNGSLLNGTPNGNGTMNVQTVTLMTSGTYSGYLKLQTNISNSDSTFYPFNNGNANFNVFTRWVLRFPPYYHTLTAAAVGSTATYTYMVGESHEIIADVTNDASGYRVFYIHPPYSNPNDLTAITGYTSPETTATQSILPSSATPTAFPTNGIAYGIPTGNSYPFALDGRYLHAFNGPGMAAWGNDFPPNGSGLTARPKAELGNFRYNGGLLTAAGIVPALGNPDTYGMDEDYDACDLENWFLAIQSADGQVVIPSFHRPGVLSRNPDMTLAATDNDWTRVYDPSGSASAAGNFKAVRAMSRILRPRAAEGHSSSSFPDLTPDPATNKIHYDVDNDGDGASDSVWLDLGYPAKRDGAGKLFKPLYAFMVIGLNGRLPLNTAGNLQKRLPDGFPAFDHADHLGNSPSEIDLRYALQNAYDPTIAANPFVPAGGAPYTQVDNAGVAAVGDTPIPVSLTQLRNILRGTRLPDPKYDPNKASSPAPTANGDRNSVVVNSSLVTLPNGVYDFADYVQTPNTPVMLSTPPVAGRWAEEDYVPKFLPVAFHGSYYIDTNPVRAGHSAAASAFDARDDNFNTFDPWPAAGVSESNNASYPADYYDASGGIAFPVERIRRFVTPVDLAGDGRVKTFNTIVSDANQTPNGGNIGADPFGRVSFFHYFRPPGIPVITQNSSVATRPAAIGRNAQWFDPLASNYDVRALDARSNNLYHGFMSYLSPDLNTTNGNTYYAPLAVAGMPSDPSGTVTTIQNTTATTPTFSYQVNSEPLTGGTALYNPSSYGMNDADEMDLFGPTRLDAPFGPADLEWLYRAQDVDGSSLQSRLAYLAPISFGNPRDGFRRRRLFALDSYDPITYSFSTDNPSGAFAQNSRFTNLQNASFANQGVATPQSAHRERRINLNFPLPVSNRSDEPIRQKWMRDMYTFLKLVLPPKAVDTPEELAQLSQYVVNIVDFRDPDCAMTKFVNTDVIVTPPTTKTGAGSMASMGLSSSVSVPFDVTISPSVTPVGLTAPANYLIQYGMEYQPVAINEVLAFNGYTKVNAVTTKGTPDPANFVPRIFIELVNTLCKDGIPAVGTTPDTSDLDLTGWDFVLMADDGLGRPDPYTGQIPTQATAPNVDAVWLNGVKASTTTPTTGSSPVIPSLLTTATPGNEGTNYYYVFANSEPVVKNDTAVTPLIVPASTNKVDELITWLKAQPSPDNNYYWLYLRRPPNPFDASYDPTKPNDNRVVVDSFRFVYTKSTGTGYTDSSGKDQVDVAPTGAMFSLQRMQPYRGGHAVPPLAGTITGGAANFVLTPYGFSEQTSAAGTTATYATYGKANTTTAIANTIGTRNVPADDSWDYLPFNDRDFTSVVELLMVPATAPGLFTKQFAEQAPPIAGSVPTPTGTAISPTYLLTAGPWQTTTPATPVMFSGNGAPHSSPYLNDEFFYTASNEWTWPGPASPPAPNPVKSAGGPGVYIGGPSGAGWHKALNFFEVPGPSYKSIGNVALGTNYDWSRQDLRPGLLNLNLIIDEEVFLGLMGEGLYTKAGPSAHGALNPAQGAASPLIVTQVDDYGSPGVFNSAGVLQSYTAYNMPNVGVTDQTTTAGVFGNQMKACFIDFLKLRHGGSNFAFGYGTGATGQDGSYNATTKISTPVASERPYRSLSFPDIDYTILRPATLPPSAFSTPATLTVANVPQNYPNFFNGLFPAYPTTNDAVLGSTPKAPVAGAWVYTQDTGVKSPYLYTRTDPVQPPPIPPRRLFQISDYWGYQAGVGTTTPPPSYTVPPSNASSALNYNAAGTQIATGDPAVNNQVLSPALANTRADLTTPILTAPVNLYLGGANPATTANPIPAPADQRDHPYFRTEWLQKVANLTTVRTHQYAVWITVGFFEVTRQGDPMLATNPALYSLAYDTLGAELGVLEGNNTRYRGFFLVDRTKATGFNPTLPSDFRDCVVYRQLIE